ncbi:MAG: hypothetical protein AAF513_05745 [Pseudomonadota bacterium]
MNGKRLRLGMALVLSALPLWVAGTPAQIDPIAALHSAWIYPEQADQRGQWLPLDEKIFTALSPLTESQVEVRVPEVDKQVDRTQVEIPLN